MPEHIWKPVEAVSEGVNVQITYRNEQGKEFIYTVNNWGCGTHALCWPRCRGDWPGCKVDCPALTKLEEKWAAEEKEYQAYPV